MGLSLGGSTGGSKSNSNATETNTYTPGQTSLQDTLMQAFSKLLPGVTTGGIGPNVTAMQTQNADTINKSYDSAGTRMNRFLAARGFGASGESGKTQLGLELGRQGDLARNNSNAAGQQLNFNQGLLTDSLLAAFNKIGATGSSSDSSSGWGFGAGVKATIPGFG